jgi:maleylacetate reductase
VIAMPARWTHTALAQQLVFGPGSLDRLPEVVKVLGARRAMLVTTEGRLGSPDGERVQRALGRGLASTFSEVQSHVPVPVVQQAVLQARRDGVDVVVSFGGGSCADLGKAVCFFLEQEAGMPGASHVDRPVVPHVSIPTTYSGAELTPFFGMTDPATKQKQGAGGPTSAPVVALYDPDLTASTPARVRAETGMNALAHCVEAAYSPFRTPEAEAIALAGARTIHTALPRVVAEPDDAEARGAMLAGAALAGRCLLNASMGVHHGLAQLVGGRTGIPHGLANAILLTHVVAFNEPAVPSEVAAIGSALGGDAVASIDRLREGLELPARLSEVGVDEADLEAVARLSQANANVARNPRPVSEDDALSVLRAAW